MDNTTTHDECFYCGSVTLNGAKYCCITCKNAGIANEKHAEEAATYREECLSVTDDQIEALCIEAGQYGDRALVDTCYTALYAESYNDRMYARHRIFGILKRLST